MMPSGRLLGFLVTLSLTGVLDMKPAHESLKPQRVHFQSRNFHNILRWHPGQACSNNGSLYFVQYKVYGEKEWKNKEKCWGIQDLFCDLTNETSNIREPYYARVMRNSNGINSSWVMTKRFIPWWETKIGPPVINITQINGSLLVILHAPSSPYRDPKGGNVTMENYYKLEYRVFIMNKLLEKEQIKYEGAHRIVEIEALTTGTGYCVTAEIYQPLLGRQGPRSERRCVQVP
ncbi:PREDICTED: interleukin-22 receptor subunit alpha-2 [Condylura cristata]|uniref:interleukin-22 receptor subunit alpha-2 n=1 Tax=Condylura cristata TaxID=143302 RepID=UPI00033431C3|nr:PREDICTED: interleukin-22 receptor subunit alpha-2 [Condylura cristata]